VTYLFDRKRTHLLKSLMWD